ncbi:aldo/keto reductase [Candidatus Sumerlaeota bacterium]|nr:aldo/keto reductase [Candidatus Sumerlaeota bacterium]
MEYRQLGHSEVKVSEISLGCWTMGGLNWVNGTPNGWANVDEDAVTGAIKIAVDAGVNHFDNADVYGNGKAERMLARVLKKLGLKSEDFIIATKVGHHPGTAEHAYEPRHIRHQCEQSLINLQRDYIDVYYLHHGWFGENDKYLQGAADVLDQLVQEGKIRVKGQSAYGAGDFIKAVPVVKPAVLQSWAHAMDTQFIRPGSDVAQLMEEHKMSFVAFSPLRQGILLDKFDPDNPPQFEEGDHRKNNGSFQPEYLRQVKPKMAQLKERFGDSIEDLASVALRYVLNYPNVACVIPGFRNERQVACNLSGAGRQLNEDDMKFVRELLEAGK